jgi:predicted MFS family arabinose efflux permease
LPLGTPIGHAAGWRATFDLVATAAGLEIVALALYLPGAHERRQSAHCPTPA